MSPGVVAYDTGVATVIPRRRAHRRERLLHLGVRAELDLPVDGDGAERIASSSTPGSR